MHPSPFPIGLPGFLPADFSPVLRILCKKRDNFSVSFSEKAFGILVLLGYDITAFTPAAYLRSRLLRPSMEISS